MVIITAEGRFDVIIHAPNRSVDHNTYYPLLFELPAVWADISNAIQGFKEHSTTRVVLNEVLGLELSNFARLLKLRPGVDDNHVFVQQVANDLWFRQMDYVRDAQERMVGRNLTSSEEDLMALALRSKPHTKSWLYLPSRVCTLGEDAFEHALAVIKEKHEYLKVAKKNGRPATESSEGSSPINWLKQGACPAPSCGIEGHLCGTSHCLNTLSEQHRQLTKWSKESKLDYCFGIFAA